MDAFEKGAPHETMPKAADAPQRPRACRNCGTKFTPTRTYPVQVFCKDACRKEHHRNGPVNRAAIKKTMRKIAAQESHSGIPRKIAAKLAELEARIEELERKIQT